MADHKHFLKDETGLTAKQRITPEEFVAEYLKTRRNATRAIKNLQPELTQYSAENKASRLLNNAQVAMLLDDIDDLIKIGATKGIKRVLSLVDSDDEQVATTNAWRLIEHAKGKATQKIEQHTTSVNLNLDLTSITGEQQG